jgi:putative transposase
MDPLDLITSVKTKRYFRATKKLNSPGVISHITQRAAGKELLFIENSDYLFMLSLLRNISINYLLDIYAFCLMPNHVHLLLSPKETNLYDAMRDLFSRYAMNFNRKYERKGHLFGGPYMQLICSDASYLLAASLYIHLYPAKSGLVPAPLKYRWSSIKFYRDDNASMSFIDPYFILDSVSEDNVESKEQYFLLIEKGMELTIDNVMENETAIEDFYAKLSVIFPSLFRLVDQRSHIARPSGIDLLNLNDLERQIEEIRMGSFINNRETRKAKKYLMEQLIGRGYKRSEIADHLGVSRKTVYNILKI